MNPMTRCRADADAVPMAIMATYYGQRAAAGLIITEGTAPSANGRGYTRQPGLWTDAQVAGAGGGWKAVTAAVKAKGGTIFAQLMHTGGVSHKANMTAAARVIAPSAVALAGQMYTDTAGMQDYPVPEAMTAADIVATKAEIVASTRNAIAAGFDGVERHRANGYLLEEFLNPHTNQRTDGYGSFDRASGQAALNSRAADLIGMGRAFIANPDLIARLKTGVALAMPGSATFCTPDAASYSDCAAA